MKLFLIISSFILIFNLNASEMIKNKKEEISLSSCMSCHGKFFEKSALNKSKVVKNMSQSDIFETLKGYKNGTYGGSMKGLMQSKLSKFNIEDLKEISILINDTKQISSNFKAFEIYRNCKSCHGIKGEKFALGKSRKIGLLNSQQLTNALIGYKNGTYGGSMKGLMKSQVIRFSREELILLANYIYSLNHNIK